MGVIKTCGDFVGGGLEAKPRVLIFMSNEYQFYEFFPFYAEKKRTLGGYVLGHLTFCGFGFSLIGLCLGFNNLASFTSPHH